MGPDGDRTSLAAVPSPERAAARAAGLHYVDDRRPGLSREAGTDGFVYRDAQGRRIDDEETLARIRRLAIPPAYTEVWICADPQGHLQASGRDARGRKQYRYHPDWRSIRDAHKYDRMREFGRALPRIRRRLTRDLERKGLPRERVLATVLRLLETTLIRVGNAEYARSNKSYGLTTLRDRHVAVSGDRIHFQFRGKSGVRHTSSIGDRRLARIVRRCMDLPGQELFQYVDRDGSLRPVGSADVNDYLRQLAGTDFTAKDYRTWAGSAIAMCLLQQRPCETESEAKRNVVEVIREVSQRLGNTPAVCRKCYVHPAVVEAYLDGKLPGPGQGVSRMQGLDEPERALLGFLDRIARKRPRRLPASAPTTPAPPCCEAPEH